MLRKLYPGGGSIFATPCIDAKRRSIYCATLQGLMAAYNMVRLYVCIFTCEN